MNFHSTTAPRTREMTGTVSVEHRVIVHYIYTDCDIRDATAGSGGGGGGGRGIIYVFYKSLSGTFSFDVSGGAGGTGDYNGADGSAGSAATFQV